MTSTTAAATVACLIALGVFSSSAAPAATTPPEVVERARKALAEAGISADLRLVSSEPTEWPDSSLGCRQPGMQYLQVITAGYALRFAGDDGRTHTVHVAGETAVVCMRGLDTGRAKNAAGGYRAPDMQMLVEKARKDLAARLGAPLSEIRLQDVESMTWPDENLGCSPAAGEASKPRAPASSVAGFRLALARGGQLYTYHTDSQRTIPCPPIEAE